MMQFGEIVVYLLQLELTCLARFRWTLAAA